MTQTRRNGNPSGGLTMIAMYAGVELYVCRRWASGKARYSDFEEAVVCRLGRSSAFIGLSRYLVQMQASDPIWSNP